MYELTPDRIKSIPNPDLEEEVTRYIVSGTLPNPFLRAILCNDLRETYFRADHNNIKLIYEWVTWWWGNAPAQCWGSSDKMRGWHEAGGLNGQS